MADPIVCDCSNSTRIRAISPNGVGDMPGLLNIHDLSEEGVLVGTGKLPRGATGSQELVRPGDDPVKPGDDPVKPGDDPVQTGDVRFKKITIMYQDATGKPFTIERELPKSFLIASDLGQNVRGDFPDARHLIITIFSTVTDPIVEGKQLRVGAQKKGQRRYIVDNAGQIQTISLNDGAPVFNAAAPGNGAVTPILYVSVVITT